MNFYSDKLINNIVDNSPLETMIEELESFKNQYEYLILRYSSYTIHHKYTLNILNNTKNFIIAFYCLDIDFDLNNCPSILIYKKCKHDDEIHYYILFTCTKQQFRGQGYASKLFDGILERIKEENKNTKKKVKIILSSLETSVLFYESYGFKWTRKCIKEYPKLLNYELYKKNKEYFIMELEVKNTEL